MVRTIVIDGLMPGCRCSRPLAAPRIKIRDMRVLEICCILLAGSLSAQQATDLFRSAPPAVDQALRERVQGFYEAHKTGKFRQADQFVHEDSKDYFFEADKRRCRSFSIARINYDDSFSKATVVIECETEVLIPPRGLTTVKMPLTSKWKIDGGAWFWYTEPRQSADTPFGKMKAGDGAPASPAVVAGPSVADLHRMVRIDKEVVGFTVGQPGEAEVVLESALPGTITLSVEGHSHDLALELDRTELKEKGSARLQIRYRPSAEQPRAAGQTQVVRLRVEPISRVFAIQIEFR